MNIKPISDLRNYNTVLKDCQADSPVFLTKNGRGRYVIMDAEQYDSIMAEMRLMSKIVKAEQRIENGESYLEMSELKKKLGMWGIMKLKINPQVYDDLVDIKASIAEDSPEQAVKVVAKILSDMERLVDFPESGNKLSNKIRFEVKYRYIITYSYALVYYVEDDSVIVTTVLHLARDFSAIKFED